jgi:hypothetical protein
MVGRKGERAKGAREGFDVQARLSGGSPDAQFLRPFLNCLNAALKSSGDQRPRSLGGQKIEQLLILFRAQSECYCFWAALFRLLPFIRSDHLVSFPLRLQSICNCLGLIFLKITCICLASEWTAVSVRFIWMPIALELSPVSANLRSLSSSACVHGREAKWAGSVIGPCVPWAKANPRAFEVALITSYWKALGERAKAAGLAIRRWLPPDRGRRGVCLSNGRRQPKA